MSEHQTRLEFNAQNNVTKDGILDNVEALIKMHKTGMLGGETMPEDSNPSLPKDSKENYLYFTLPMALNYQRNSYKLWESAKRTYLDKGTHGVFDPKSVVSMTDEELREKLTKYKLALQPNKHPSIWRKISETLENDFEGDPRNLFKKYNHDIPTILAYVQKENKRGFPYLSGAKICTYWLYVMEQYTSEPLSGREHLSIAPDTHVIQASVKLGVIDKDIVEHQNIREKVSEAWRVLLEGTKLLPIDIHTPLWLWSRGNFINIENE